MYKIGEIETHRLNNYPAVFVEMARNHKLGIVLNSNTDALSGKPHLYQKYDLIAGYSDGEDPADLISELDALRDIRQNNKEWYLGYLSYDLKNKIENLHSENPDSIGWPDMLFFKPEILFTVSRGRIAVFSKHSGISLKSVRDRLNAVTIPNKPGSMPRLKPSLSRAQYLEKVGQLKSHIQRGDIYEVNFCMEFNERAKMDPYTSYRLINTHTPAPFSVFLRYADRFLLSASPERFLLKQKNTLCSQPIKGTAPRGRTARDDHMYKEYLRKSLKERSENIMITDLVRNDLSRIARRKSVEVEELCGIYDYPHVFQMISTVKARVDDITMLDVIRSTFPMGSMTGAPKIKAMELIEKYECMKRGLYSGSVGYIGPAMDFDLNVVIRSLQYNARDHHISYIAGSAITALSEPEKEYEECLLKAYAINPNETAAVYV